MLSAFAVAAVLLLLAGGLLFYLFKVTVERNFDARLEAVMNGLLANIEVDARGRPWLRSRLADPRFALPMSGWYWRIAPADGAGPRLASKSLLDLDLSPPPGAARDAAGVAHFYLEGPQGLRLRALEQQYTLFGGKRPYSILVAGNFDELRAEMSAFTSALVIILAVLGLALALAIFVQVRYGLRPLVALHDELAEIREGRRERLEGSYPDEIRPVAEELNLLLRANREIVERARTQVGNLAHALKTPLSVLTNEARREGAGLAEKVLQQVGIMRDQVQLYLDRARRAAQATGLGGSTPVREVVEAIVRTLQRIHRDSAIAVDLSGLEGLRFRGERQDLEEMLGNLLDNAFKYARRRIAVSARLHSEGRHHRRWIVLTVEDDGPGLPEEHHEKALRRGQRLDETRPGSGLGLSIVHETASMYHGEVRLERSSLGGLRARLRLPAAAGPGASARDRAGGAGAPPGRGARESRPEG